jgi:uncharacterized repeat protein (TIGR01451 family)
MQRSSRPIVSAIFAGLLCALAAGCLSGNPTYFPYLLPGGSADRTHAKPAGLGYFADFDPHAKRLEVRPDAVTIPVRGTQVLIATIYDEEGRPRRKRRVEWMIEGPGTIVEVDESGYMPGRGMKVDNKYAFSHTDYFEHVITRGNDDPNDDFMIRPGQTWIAITSAVEGQTNVIVYAPEIHDWERNKVYVKLNWVDANLQYPPSAYARAGGEHTFTTRVAKRTDDGKPGDFRVRYRIIDGPAAALTGNSREITASVREAEAVVGDDGTARVRIAQPLATTGTNRVAIEVVRVDPAKPGEFKVVSQGESKVTWQSPELNVNVSAPKTAALRQEFNVTYAVASTGGVEISPSTLTAEVPEGLELIRTEPKAVVDGPTLIWTLPATNAGKQQTVQAVYRTSRIGSVTLAADARTQDGLKSQSTAGLQVTEGKLQVRLEGPKAGVVGEALAFQIVVSNDGDAPAEQVRIKARFDEGLESASKTQTVEEKIDYLPAGKSRAIPLPLVARQGGKFRVEAGAAAEGNLLANPQAAAIEIQDAQLSLKAYGPSKVYVGQEVEWKLIVQNGGEVPLDNVRITANLPADVTFFSASDGGRSDGRQIVWDIGTAPPLAEKEIVVKGIANRINEKALLTATTSAKPSAGEGKNARTVSMVKPLGEGIQAQAGVQIVGVPSLQIGVRDTVDPVGVGQRTSYQITVKNSGSVPATRVDVTAEVPVQMRALKAAGVAGTGKIDGQSIAFPRIESLEPGAELRYTVDVEVVASGDARFRAEARSAILNQPQRAEEPTRVLGLEARPRER